MSDYNGRIEREVVKIKILRADPGSWYADKVGQVVEAFKETTDYGVSYKQYPPPTGREPSGHYSKNNVEKL